MLRRFLLVSLLLVAAGCTAEGELTSDQKKLFIERYTELAQQYYQMGELDRAQGQCEKGLALDPNNDRLKLIMAWTLQRRGKTEDIARAEQLFRGLQSTGDFRAILGLGEALERKGMACSEAAQAIRSGKRVTEAADPEKRIAEFEAVSLKAWNEARDQYMKALELQHNDPDAFNGMLRVETLLGHTKEALVWAQKLIEVTQGDLDFWQQKKLQPDLTAREENRFRDLVKSLTTLEVATLLHASELSVALEQDEGALKYLDEAMKLDNTQPEIYSRRAQLLKELGRYKEAIVDIESYIAMSNLDFQHPDIQRAWRLRSECDEAIRQARAKSP